MNMNILIAGSLESLLQLVGALIIFMFVLVITYLTTRWMGQYQKGRSHNKNLRIVETISVGNNTFISIVEAGTRYLVVSISKEQTRLLTELTKEELKDLSFLKNEETKMNVPAFSEMLEKAKDKWPKKHE